MRDAAAVTVDKPITQNEDALYIRKVSQPNQAGSISLRHDRLSTKRLTRLRRVRARGRVVQGLRVAQGLAAAGSGAAALLTRSPGVTRGRQRPERARDRARPTVTGPGRSQSYVAGHERRLPRTAGLGLP
jgi:hypothetical protein